MSFYPRDLRFEQGHTLIQLVLTVGCKIFFGELARRIALGAREVVKIHCRHNRLADGLLSMRSLANREKSGA